MGKWGIGAISQIGDDPEEWGTKWQDEVNPHEPDNEREFWDELSGKRLETGKVRNVEQDVYGECSTTYHPREVLMWIAVCAPELPRRSWTVQKSRLRKWL